MTTPAHISPFQFVQQPDGSMALQSLPNITLETVEQQGTVTGRDWQGELGLPTYYEEWELMARIRSSRQCHRIPFIVMDESPTRLPGHPRIQPKRVILPQMCQLELGHTGFIIGMVDMFMPCFDEGREVARSLFDLEIPEDLDGNFIIGGAGLFDSPLAQKAREGMERGIFTHVCPLLFRPNTAPQGTGQLVMVSLVPGDLPGCPNARVLKRRGPAVLPAGD